MGTPAAELAVVVFNALTSEEQDDAYARISELRLAHLTDDDDAATRPVKALRRVTEIAAKSPSPDDYRRVRVELRAQGDDCPVSCRVAPLPPGIA